MVQEYNSAMSELFSHHIETDVEAHVERGPEPFGPSQEPTPEQMLLSMKKGLGLGIPKLAKMFGLEDRREINDWLRGEIPALRVNDVNEAYSSFTRLQSIFKSGRLPGWIRRRAPIFSNDRAIDFILDGRIAEVVDAAFPIGGDIMVEVDNFESRKLTRNK